MDQILVGILQSDKPDALKEQFVLKVLERGLHPQSVADVRSMLQTCMQCILQHQSDYAVQSCKNIYQRWSKNNPDVLAGFFTNDTLQFLMNSQPTYAVDMLWVVQESMRVLPQDTPYFQQLCKIIQLRAISFVRDNPNFPTITEFCRLLSQFRYCIPQGTYTATFCIAIINAVGTFSVPQDVHQYVQGVSQVIGGLLQHIWSCVDEDSIIRCLQAIFVIISKDTKLDPSFALGGIVQHIPTKYVPSVTRYTVSDDKITDTSMKLALHRMIDWLSWPGARNIDLWIVAFLKELAANSKYSILIEITEAKIGNVFDKLKYPFVQGSAFAVLSHMLLSFQHSPQPFHKIVVEVPKMIKLLREQRPPVPSLIASLAKLLHTLIYLHPGFPDLYEPVLESLMDYGQPSIASMQEDLAHTKWAAQHRSGSVGQMADYTLVQTKSDTGKTGLHNLGNTCYMNSIIQVLYMCDSFRKEVLAASLSLQQQLLLKLQKTFAFLSITQRPAYSPSSLLEVSRPPWFTPGCQQDCSEYLRYVLDQLHEQELTRLRKERDSGESQHVTGPLPASPPKDHKEHSTFKFKLRSAHNKARQKEGNGPKGAVFHDKDHELDPTLIQQMFGGNILNTYTCLVCRKESSRMESFNDLPLAFPEGGSRSPGGTLYKPTTKRDRKTSLAGGESVSSQTNSSHTEPTTSAEKSEPGLSLEDLLAYYLEPERLEGANKYHCDNCGCLQDAERRIKIISSPEYLIITLLRFSYNAKTHSRSKIFSDVKYPKTLYLPVNEDISMDLSPPHSTCKKSPMKDSPPPIPRRLDRKYSERLDVYGLCGVVVHSGLSSDGGHYYCYARHSIPAIQTEQSQGSDMDDLDYLQDRWYLFNDSRVSYSSYASFSTVTKKFIKDTAYVLIYKKVRPGDIGGTAKVHTDLPLRQDLREAVEKDNRQFLQEQEAAERARAARRQQQAASTANWYQGWGDHNGPPGSCGGGGGGGGFSTGPRFVC